MAARLTKAQRAKATREAWRLSMDGWHQTQIAEKLGISQSQVSRYLAKTSERVASRIDSVAKTFAVVSMNRSDVMYHEAFEAFRRSKEPKRRATKKTSAAGSTTGAPSGDGTTTTDVLGRDGDPVWLSEARASIRMGAEMLDRLLPARESKSDETSGVGTVADALIEAERRDAAYAAKEKADGREGESPDVPERAGQPAG